MSQKEGKKMRYKKQIEMIKKSLEDYKNGIYELALAFKSAICAIQEEAESMKGKWTDEYIKCHIENEKKINSAKFRVKTDELKKQYEPLVLHCLEVLEKRMEGYFNAPANADFLNKINSIKLTGLQLSNREFEMLKKSAHSYMECRLLNELAETRMKTEQKTTLDETTGQPKIEKTKEENPYLLLKVPNMETVMNGFEDYQSNVLRVINSYCGADAELYDVLEVAVPKHVAITSDSYFRNGTHEKFEKIMEEATAIMPERKKTLSENDKELIDSMVNPTYPSLAKETVQKIASHSAEMLELFELDERYAKFVEEMEI